MSAARSDQLSFRRGLVSFTRLGYECGYHDGIDMAALPSLDNPFSTSPSVPTRHPTEAALLACALGCALAWQGALADGVFAQASPPGGTDKEDDSDSNEDARRDDAPRADDQTRSDDEARADEEDAGAEDTVEDPRARELFLKGERLYIEGAYDEAATAFLESYELSKRPALLFNVSNAYERAGRIEEALAAMRDYAPHAPEYNQHVIARRIRAMEERLQEAAASAPAPPAEEPASEEPTPVAVSPTPEHWPRDEGLPVAPIVTIGAGVLALGVGTVFGILSSSQGSDLEAACTGGVCLEALRDDVDAESTYAAIADVGFLVGTVAAATGLVWLLIAADDGSEQVSASASPTAAALHYSRVF